MVASALLGHLEHHTRRDEGKAPVVVGNAVLELHRHARLCCRSMVSEELMTEGVLRIRPMTKRDMRFCGTGLDSTDGWLAGRTPPPDYGLLDEFFWAR